MIEFRHCRKTPAETAKQFLCPLRRRWFSAFTNASVFASNKFPLVSVIIFLFEFIADKT